MVLTSEHPFWIQSLFVFTWGINEQLLPEVLKALKNKEDTELTFTLLRQKIAVFQDNILQLHGARWQSRSVGGLLRIHVGRVVRGLADGVRCSSTSCHGFMVGWGSWWLHGIWGRILRRVGRDWHPRLRLDGHGLVALVRSCRVVGRHSLCLWVWRVNHCCGGRGGHNRLRSSTCFVQTATRASEAQNYSNDDHCKNDHSNRNKSSKTAREMPAEPVNLTPNDQHPPSSLQLPPCQPPEWKK